MAGRILGSAWWAGFTFNGITAYGDGHDSLIGGEELCDGERDALLELCRERQDHLLFMIQGAHGGTPGQWAMLVLGSIVPMPRNQQPNGETKGRKITRHGLTDLFQIHTQIIVHQNISHAGDGLPRS